MDTLRTSVHQTDGQGVGWFYAWVIGFYFTFILEKREELLDYSQSSWNRYGILTHNIVLCKPVFCA